ncbi:MAG: cupin domain-containing protein [Dehalococcoidia bacterium]
MKVTSLDQTPRIKVDMEGAKDAFKQVPLSREDGAPVFVFRVFTIEPGGHTPYHQHPYEHLNYVIKGHGTLVTGEGEGINIREGNFAMVLPWEMHQYRNDSDSEPLVIICAVPRESE